MDQLVSIQRFWRMKLKAKSLKQRLRANEDNTLIYRTVKEFGESQLEHSPSNYTVCVHTTSTPSLFKIDMHLNNQPHLRNQCVELYHDLNACSEAERDRFNEHMDLDNVSLYFKHLINTMLVFEPYTSEECDIIEK